MKTPIQSSSAPQAVGPYSQGILTDDFIFLAGQIPLDPATGQLTGQNVTEQTERVLQNIEALLKAAGCTMDDVVKATVFLMDLGQFAAMNEVYARYFKNVPPARSTIQVAGLPKGAQVEIEVIARKN